ncbi:CCR4-NOT transcription complex subunit 1 [Schistosoma japonicum]|uniref:CCR4-NOT transcription complex subunit 1 n=1 Tax=Schistosoma japonicum TaxID=6182 RepID=A0A4Z2DNF2_SCHJA|nr:CCR4-NOT transcription complex subunit 1 [Schistosoma japonicum]
MELKYLSQYSITPSDNISKKICFIMNNITKSNLKGQIDEIISIMPNYSIQWLAYSLLNRIATEFNQHDVYYEFILMITKYYKNFDKLMLNILINEIHYILNVLHFNTTYNGKVLKYYGRFLGRLTIVHNLPLWLDINALIYTTYKNKSNSLNYIIQFITELLKNIKYNTRIKLSNSWIKEILEVLKELHSITDKLTIQFEIELLFNYLECDFNQWKTAYYLRQ